MDHDLHKCHEDDCKICLGDLASCDTCGGAEAALPTDCPGKRMDGDTLDAVQAGDIDYKDGKWLPLREGVRLP